MPSASTTTVSYPQGVRSLVHEAVEIIKALDGELGEFGVVEPEPDRLLGL